MVHTLPKRVRGGGQNEEDRIEPAPRGACGRQPRQTCSTWASRLEEVTGSWDKGCNRPMVLNYGGVPGPIVIC